MTARCLFASLRPSFDTDPATPTKLAFPKIPLRYPPPATMTTLCLPRSLHLLHDKVLGRALQIVDQGHVKCFVAEQSQRRLFVVRPSLHPLSSLSRDIHWSRSAENWVHRGCRCKAKQQRTSTWSSQTATAPARLSCLTSLAVARVPT